MKLNLTARSYYRNSKKQEAQLLPGWPTVTKSIFLLVKVIESSESWCPIAIMEPSLTGETPHNNFDFSDLEMTPVKVIQGHMWVRILRVRYWIPVSVSYNH